MVSCSLEREPFAQRSPTHAVFARTRPVECWLGTVRAFPNLAIGVYPAPEMVAHALRRSAVALALSACAAASSPTHPSPPPAPADGAAAVPAMSSGPESDASAADSSEASRATDAATPDAETLEAAAELEVRHPFHEALPPAHLPSRSPARRIANLSPAACRAEAKRRKLAVSRDRRPTPGVATAFRIQGPIGGIRFRTAGRSSRFGVFDCRLGLIFDEMAKVLSEHDVSQVIAGTIYRPGSRLRRRVKSQHAHGLAVDVVAFVLSDGRRVSVEHDWEGAIGEPVCGPDARATAEKAVIMRNIVCDLTRSGLFHHILTPNYDRPHYDHFHLDIKRDARRAIIR